MDELVQGISGGENCLLESLKIVVNIKAYMEVGDHGYRVKCLLCDIMLEFSVA